MTSGSPDDSTRYAPSPSERVRAQVALYEANGGSEGGTLEGRPVVILTTIGAQSGQIRKTPVIRIEHSVTYVAVASAAGAPRNPSWCHNLVAHPDVGVQDGSTIHALRAREVFGDEKARWWRVAEAGWPHFPEYRAKAGREIPVLLLEPLVGAEQDSRAPKTTFDRTRDAELN
ncbi:MAG: deazaflavin-dependent nitroreductase family protein [Acidimicrobiaceae bacterium]|nr:deazaflavin-dependent nitroreductase family protein [Acidimicrobiaceae bacterium]